MRVLIYLLAASVLAGCSTLADKQNDKLVDAQIQQLSKPTFSVEMGDNGAVKKIEYHDPRDRQAIRLPTNGWDATIAVSNSLTGLVAGAVPYAAVGAVAVTAIKHAGHNSQVVTTHTASGAGSSTAGPGSYAQIGPDSANTTTTSGDTTTDSHDTQTADSHDISGSYNPADSHDQTAAPTVVNPVVVQVPAQAP